ALASNDAPDVIEVGNTQVAQYAASGGVKDLSDRVTDLKGADWLPGLAEPGKIDGKQYGIPWYAANRVVLYNKDLFAKAGIKKPPATRDEWLS
ncbi:extracellular solute-binding protein, partial [Streptomyces sp. SID11233]|nr:extracellular solute-binding protein [Streptomyces sp. SID11233]